MVQIPIDVDAPNLNRKKETRIYYRSAKDAEGNLIWMPTLPLPADPWHLNYYTKKGFKLWPPGHEPGQEELKDTQEKIAALEEQATAIKTATAVSEDAKAGLDTEVKVLEEQARNLKSQIGKVEVDTSKGKISCPEPDCTAVVNTYIGLARHMKSKHGTK